jgi:hypothetical protein
MGNMVQKKLEWYAFPTYSFKCEQCQQLIPSGNPRACPHQNGKRVVYDPGKYGMVKNMEEVRVKCGEGVPVRPFTPPPKPMTTEEIVAASCAHGT